VSEVLIRIIYTASSLSSASVAGCRNYSTRNLVSEELGWIQFGFWEIRAVIPKGFDSYTQEEFKKGETPELQKMLQTLLEDRFKAVYDGRRKFQATC